MTKNIYDNINTLVGKEVGALHGTSTFLQRVIFTYNIRGWLTQINDVDNSQLVNPNLFSLKLNYNKFGTDNSVPGSNPTPTDEIKPLFNGNIRQQIWRTAKSNIKSVYKYDYDDLNRLKNATFQYPGMITGMANAYNEKLTYDKNGNIITLKRNGAPVLNNVIEIDDLQYSYEGNQLQTVTDATANAAGFRKGSHSGIDYTYDGFGNMITDKNKGITDIKYNHLNLPTEITITGGKINYIYNAVGAKVQKIVTPTSGVSTTTDYLGGFQYENGQLQFFPTAEGYYNAQTNKYVYQYKDHLGNVRLSYSDTNGDGLVSQDEVLSENNYYPFGLQHQGDNAAVAQSANKAAEQYKYNGKEFQDELGLGLYDYGARNYDAALGRWMNVDPLAEVSRRFSPYTYVLNNPVRFIDPDGMMAVENDDIIIRGKNLSTGELKPIVVVKTELIDVMIDTQIPIIPTHDPITNRENEFKPIEINGIDKQIQIFETILGKADAISISLGGSIVAGGGISGNTSMVAFLTGKDAEGIFQYSTDGPSPSLGISIGGGVEIGAIFASPTEKNKFNRNSVTGYSINLSGGYGPINGSLSMGVKNMFDWTPTMYGVSLGTGYSSFKAGASASITSTILQSTLKNPKK
ncbi:RHS repeat domain-containing protein [Flavobacterium sp. HSC-61S13]|uniref:RHS repeat domain-containing protein n=1 Tax=Flavobacterium sp. HSC-61S13 TaxID=2910963 RepID=UPI0020A0944D|nr:RHS repeat-associated core domain-containing protein [Flavobacterium sp. HSC-61S13]MCP1995516.1 RHS repeat-associated protein [Flavobacterium sp. HSC-61S13]